MSERAVRVPGPDHPISIAPSGAHVIVRAAGRVIADTRRALVLREASYPPVFYIPREDADMAALKRSTHASWCPYKGEASYYSVADGTANAVWTYETPHEAVAEILGHLAFYPDRVDAIEVG
ncbi:DUF427 domain-containing protein [Sphingomonas sp. AOB5]|uniref:DUF427 domain-containing protein n=1 Tax=Sphingomonas sp. AOB5 TaxID=3034017 RepID=UPI0023F8AD7A|nr:DUF427 domain-containing protein [Sphingomonas sp. AOB5]MDF7777594.1 DUF427 domain-containing protein [Sphingomonas sp. AOB5]